MITIDWGLFILMLAGTASLSASISLFLACLLMSRKKTLPQDKIGLCGHCRAVKCDVYKTEGMYMGYEKRRSK